MEALHSVITTVFNLMLVVLGFGMIVFLHEMGHFLTARWAGIRVFAFALGFGPALLSYRTGLGLRRGSSEAEYLALLDDARSEDGPRREHARELLAKKVSPTEYRLNALPFGGYVKMLGQNDLAPDPTDTHPAAIPPDSYLAVPIWKRMIVISGGVVMNLLLALAIFMVVFFVGLETEPATIGIARADSPAARAVARNAEELGVTEPGLHPDDIVLAVNGRTPDEFNDIIMAAAMTGPGEQVDLAVERAGVPEPLRFAITPERNPLTSLYDLGIEPPRTLTIPEAYATNPDAWEAFAARAGLQGVEPGMTLVAVDDHDALRTVGDLLALVRASDGSPMELTFAAPDGREVRVTITPAAELMLDDADPDPDTLRPVAHLLGLVPVMTVGPISPADRGYDQGLREGDIFARLGEIEFPGVDAGIREIERHTGKTLEVVVLRADAEGETEEVALSVEVSTEGKIGFVPENTARTAPLVTPGPRKLYRIQSDTPAAYAPVLALAIDRPGTRILAVNDQPVANFTEIREALRRATRPANADNPDQTSPPPQITLTIEPPLPPQPDGSTATFTLTLAIPPDQLDRLHALSWEVPFGTWFFQPEPFTLKASGPLDAVRMGINRTHHMMTMTYLTLARLVQGTVKVDNLKGPVGIAHLGTQVATRGPIWLIFFLGLISINLAVVNFLPLPIADGGQFLMLLYEQVRGRPLPIPVQNAVTAVGLLLLVSMFLLVTYNDVARLLGG